jgi:hypothetical protein
MKSVKSFFIMPGSLVLILCCVNTSAYAFWHDPNIIYVPGEVIVSFRPGVTESDVENLANEFNLSVVRKLRLRNRNVYLIEISDDQTEQSIIDQLANYPDVLRGELNYIFRIPDTPCIPIEPIEINPIPPNGGGQIIFDLGDVEVDPGLFWSYPPLDSLELGIVHSNPLSVIEAFNSVFLEPSLAVDTISSSQEIGSVNVAPEPATLFLLSLGMVVLRRHKRRK